MAQPVVDFDCALVASYASCSKNASRLRISLHSSNTKMKKSVMKRTEHKSYLCHIIWDFYSSTNLYLV